jgi:hypothetical protein
MEIEFTARDLDDALKLLEEGCPVWRCSGGAIMGPPDGVGPVCRLCEGTGKVPSDAGLRLLAFLIAYAPQAYSAWVERLQIDRDVENWPKENPNA